MKRKFKIGLLIKKYRLSKGLTQKEVTDKMGWTTPQFISNIERGISQPPLFSASKLRETLNIPYAFIRNAYRKDFEDQLTEAFRK